MSFPAIGRTDASALVPAPILNQLMEGIREQSLVMRSFTELPVPVTTTSMPVLQALPTAFFRRSDTGLSQATKSAWTGKNIVVDDLDVLVPIPDTVIADAQFDMWGSLRPQMTEALANALDAAVFRGEGAPSTFPTNMLSQISTASNTVNRGTAAAAAGGLAKDISDVWLKLEDRGFTADRHWASVQFKSFLRAARDTTGQRLADLAALETDILYGAGGQWYLTGTPATGDPEYVAVASREFVVGVQNQMTWDIMSEGVISDARGNILWNLAQMKMKALRLSMRVGWQVSNAANREAVSRGTNEVQRIAISGITAIGSGTFSIAFGTLRTKEIAYDATAATVQAALEEIGTIGRDNVSVARSGSTPNFTYDITFKRDLGARDITTVLTARGEVAVTTGTPAFTITTPTAGVAATWFPAAALLRP